nr:carboxypeptidase regulatory-like domain-containing protein [Streptomyces sp. NBC_00899]
MALRRTDVTARAGVVPMALPSGYGPADLHSAYGLPATGTGTPTVAVVDAYDDPNAEADLAVYRAQYGLPACTTANGCFRKTDQRGGSSHPAANPSWAGEISLDLDMVSAVAPNAHIVLVEADSALLTDLAAAENTAVLLGAGYVSNSYGGSEQPAVTSLDPAYDHPGVVITASTGDSGFGSSYPATSSHVTAVGGTTLARDSSTRGFAESAWSLGGSGCSAYFAKPSFQHDSACPKRSEADVSAVADPATGVAVYDSYEETGWGVFGGTSAAAPIVASVYALAGTPQSGTYPNSYPYQDIADLHDVTSGSNGGCGGSSICTAGSGWDGPTGLGTPSGLAAFRAPGEQGQVSGKVTDSVTGNPVSGATVAVGDATATTGADGGYRLTLPTGDQTLAVSAFGYGQKTATTTVSQGADTVMDFTLVPQPKASVSGTVTDGSGQGWPLYAAITIPGRPGAPIYTDPLTGKFSVDLPTGTSYTLHAAAVARGYRPLDQTVDLTSAGTGPVTADLKLGIDQDLCYAPGYAADYTGGHSDFEGGSLPAGWTVTNSTALGGWAFDDISQPNQTGGTGGFAIVDAKKLGLGAGIQSDLDSPVYDLTNVDDPVIGFHSDYYEMYGNGVWVSLSTDGGTTWTQVWKANDGRGPKLETVPVPQAAHQSDVRIRFHYGLSTSWDYWWAIDDAFVGTRSCDAQTGGLVAGTITDANTGAALNGAKVTVDGASVTSAPDPGQGDGFYQLFVPATGDRQLTASDAHYATATRTLTVSRNTPVRGDAALTAGRITVKQTGLSTLATLGGKESTQLTVSNTGSAPAAVTIHERGAAFTADAAKADSTGQDRTGAPLKQVKGTFSPLSPTGAAAAQASPSKAAPEAAPADASWSSLADYPTAVMDSNAGTYQGKVYSFGGASSATARDTGYVYDTQSGNWTATATMPEPRDAGAGAFIDGKYYLTGGWGNSSPTLTTLDIYDPVTDTWTTGAPIPHGYGGSGTAVLGGRLYVVGGCDATTCGHTDVQIYDPASNTWSRGANYPVPVAWEACGGITGSLYCAGGDSTTATYWAAYTYDPAADAWTSVARMPVDLWGGSYTAANGTLVVSGGVTGNNTLVTNQGWAYDPAADSWQPVPNAPVTLYRSAGACGLYRIGGSAGSFTTVATSEMLPGYDQCTESSDVNWLSESPASLTVQPGQSVTVTVGTDASAIAQPGTYSAQLVLDHNTPYGTPLVGVTMTVAPPKTWGRITGTISGAGCTATSPLAGAVVEIDSASADYAVTTSADGGFVYWVNTRNSPFQVTAAADRWRPQTQKVKLKAGATATLAFTLQPLAACG